MASDYFRIKGDFANSIICLQRAIYYSPKVYEYIPKLSLSNILHKNHFVNDSLSIALSSISTQSENPLLAYFIGIKNKLNSNSDQVRILNYLLI
jgi:hypothetical protein